MAQSAYSIPTQLGLSKQARKLALGQKLVLTHIAIGDGDRFPNGVETALLRELKRYAITANGVVPGANAEAFFEIFLEATEGPFTIREAGLIDEDGDLIAVTREDPPIQKVLPAAGRVHEFFYRMQTVFSSLENIIVRVDTPTLYVPAARAIATPAGSGLTGGGDLGENRELKVAFATAAETVAGQLDNKATHPAGVKAALDAYSIPQAKFATAPETVAGALTDKPVHPAGVKAALDAYAVPAAKFATSAQTVAGQITDKPVHPAGVKAAVEAVVHPLYFHS